MTELYPRPYCYIVLFHQEEHFYVIHIGFWIKISFLWSFSHFRDPCSQAPSMAEPPPAVVGERAFSGDCHSYFFFSKFFRSPGGFPPSSPDCHQFWQSRGILLFSKHQCLGKWKKGWANCQEAMMVKLDKQVADQMSGNVYMHASCVEDECSKVSWRSNRRTNQVLIDFSASVWLNKLASFR